MDHGHGISSIYSHLESLNVNVGDKVNQGDIIGTVGSTGRSTGPHLDFRINWFQTISLNQVLDKMVELYFFFRVFAILNKEY